MKKTIKRISLTIGVIVLTGAIAYGLWMLGVPNASMIGILGGLACDYVWNP